MRPIPVPPRRGESEGRSGSAADLLQQLVQAQQGKPAGRKAGAGRAKGNTWRKRAHSLHPTGACKVEEEGFRRMASLGSLL